MLGRQRIVIALFFAVLAIVGMGDFQARMAATHGDDGPVFYAKYAQNPAFWQGDIMALFAGTQVKVTAQNWLPTLAYLKFDIPPEQSARVLVLLQFVLLGLAVSDLARSATKRSLVSWVAPFWVLAAMPWQWNLANYESNLAMPYAADLGRPLLLLAVSRFLAKDFLLSFVFMSLLAMVHPSLTLYATLLLLCYALLQKYAPAKVFAAACLVAALAVVPALFLLGGHEQIEKLQLLEGFRLNQHISPWNYTFGLWPASWTFAGFVTLLVLALRQTTTSLNDNYRKLCWCALALTPFMALAHLLASWLGIVVVLKLLPLRFTALLVMVAVPAVLDFLLEASDSKEAWKRWASLVLLFFPSVCHFGALWGLLLALFLAQGRIVCGAWVGLVTCALVTPTLLPWLVPGSRSLSLAYLLAVMLAAVVLTLLPSVHRQKVSVLLIVLIAFLQAYQLAAPTRTPYQQDLLKAESWALVNTDPSAIFIVENAPWRTMSHRRAIVPRASIWYVYNGSKQVRDTDDAYLNFFGLMPAFHHADVLQMHFAQIQAFYSLHGESLKRFVDQFGGDYLVHSRRWMGELPKLPLEVAYSNDNFVIYDLRSLKAKP